MRRWENGKRADHFAHAAVYSEIAGLRVVDHTPVELPEDVAAFAPIGSPLAGGDSELEDLGRDLTGV